MAQLRVYESENSLYKDILLQHKLRYCNKDCRWERNARRTETLEEWRQQLKQVLPATTKMEIT